MNTQELINRLRELFGRKPKREAKFVYVEPTREEWDLLRKEEFLEKRRDMLRQGRVVLHPFTNVAPWTWGSAVLSLYRDGLVDHVVRRDGYSEFVVNSKGRQALQSTEQQG